MICNYLLHNKIFGSVSLSPKESRYAGYVSLRNWNLFFGRFILHAKKTGFVVEHDFIMATYLADRVIVFEGTPSVKTIANT